MKSFSFKQNFSLRKFIAPSLLPRSSLSLLLVSGAVSLCTACGSDGGDPPGGGASGNSGTAGDGSQAGAAGNTAAAGSGGASGSSNGTSGASGSATSGASGSAGSGTVTPLPTEAILFSEDFEAATDGKVPANWDSFVGYVVNPESNTSTAEAYAIADGSKSHGGSKALHVKGGQTPAMLTRPLPSGTNKIYMRAYIWLTGQLGHTPNNNHETLIGIRGKAGSAGDEVRFGQIKGALGTNEVHSTVKTFPSDNISPKQEQWGKGPVIPAGAWNCVEVAFVGDTANHEVRAWNDGTEIHVVNGPDQWENGLMPANFLDGNFKEFIIGWHSFSSFENELWIDDIVVATERVGCN